MEGFMDSLRIVKYNIKISLSLNIAVALLLCALTPFFFSLPYASSREMAQIGELYLSTAGIILFTYLSNLEERENVQEIVYIKRLPHLWIFFLRLFMVMALALILVLFITSYAKVQNGSFDLIRTTAGIWISATFFGIIGLTVSNFTKDQKSGYLAAFGYYMFEFFTRGKYTSDFYVFSLLNGSFSEKYRILALIGLGIAANCVLVRRRS